VPDENPSLTTFRGNVGPTVAPTLSLRPTEGSDEALLRRIFAESHCAGFELLGLAPAALDGLVRMQFQARQAQYRTHPGAAEYLICRGTGPGGTPVGSCWLSDSAEQLRVLDIAVLAEHRRRGVATAALRQLLAQAASAGKPVGLSVWHQNVPARELYRALGFVPDPTTGGGGASEPGDLGNGYLELRCLPSDAPHPGARHRAGAR
jgi:ribosomal protein S18 acetylase RimI-like enzyme